MAYEVVMPYHLHMPSYFLETFTEYPFSTKPNGQGIGLIFIREVLMKHGCTFSLRTYSDGLTRFRIRFSA